MRIAICEDQGTHAEQLLDELILAASALALPLTCQHYLTGEALLFELENQNFDLVFLDIQLPGIDGMSVAKKIRQKQPELPLVFASNYDDYVFDGYDVDAIGYLLKPITAEKISTILTKVQKRQDIPCLLVTVQRKVFRIPLFTILYLEVEGHTLFIQTQEARYQMTGNLVSYLDQLDNSFIKIHRAFMVNLRHVSRVTENEVLLSNADRLPVSRTNKKYLKEKLMSYYRRLADD